MSHEKCVVCHAAAAERPCCPDRPKLCDEHYALHREQVHAETEPKGSIDDALAAAIVNDGLDD